MTPAELNKKWSDRLHQLEYEAEYAAQWTGETGTEASTIRKFLEDIEYLTVEMTKQERENRDLISEVASNIREEVKRTGKKIELTL